MKVMIAGVGGASLGTELMKCLVVAGRYDIFGCDISRTAFGLYDPGFDRTFLVDPENYIPSVVEACESVGANWIVPGGEQPTTLLSAARAELAAKGIGLVANDPEIIRVFSDKSESFRRLSALGVPIPRTMDIDGDADIASIGLPCIVKPATGSGGSAMVFFASDIEEAMIYAEYIKRTGAMPIAQEYIGPEAGEFTIGVLSLPDGSVASSVALRRSLDSKLSVAMRGRGGVISSGYTQGYIGAFPDICAQAEGIARAIGSRGPINIQGRVRDGVLLPFEINPRLSASSYLRALAGNNELDDLLQYLDHGESIKPRPVREGWYLRSLTETFIRSESLRE